VVKVLVGAAAVAVLGWIIAPWVAMARRGTLDDHSRADMRAPVIPRPRQSLCDDGTSATGRRRKSPAEPLTTPRPGRPGVHSKNIRAVRQDERDAPGVQ
jgi:hypothetical protein